MANASHIGSFGIIDHEKAPLTNAQIDEAMADDSPYGYAAYVKDLQDTILGDYSDSKDREELDVLLRQIQKRKRFLGGSQWRRGKRKHRTKR